MTIFTSHHKVITSSRLFIYLFYSRRHIHYKQRLFCASSQTSYIKLLQGYYIKVYRGYYVTVTLTNHRPFQNRPTLDAKKVHLCSSERRESRIFGISALKTIVLKNKTKLFSTCNWPIDVDLQTRDNVGAILRRYLLNIRRYLKKNRSDRYLTMQGFRLYVH